MANWYKNKNDALQAEVAALKETIEKKDEYIRQIFSNQTAEGLNRLNKKLNTANLVIFQMEKDIKEKYVPKVAHEAALEQLRLRREENKDLEKRLQRAEAVQPIIESTGETPATHIYVTKLKNFTINLKNK